MTSDTVATRTATTDTAAVRPATSDRGARSIKLRLFAWSVVPVYVTGLTVMWILDARLGGVGDDHVEGVIISVGFGAFAVVGALLVGLRPRNAVGWIVTALALLIGIVPALDMYAAYVVTTRGEPDALAVIGAWLQSWYWYVVLALTFVYLPLLFPDGRLPSRRWWPVAVAPGIFLVGVVGLGMVADTLTGQEVDYRIDNPIGIDGLAHAEQHPAFAVLGGFLLIGVAGGLAAVGVRFHRSRGDERQQMKWFLWAVAPLVFLPLEAAAPWLSGIAFAWVVLALPVALAVAVLRYRLDGIDLVISRTLVYGVLTLLVIGVYVLVVGYLGAALHRDDDLVVSLVATGVVAVLFAPARDRLQRAVDRLLYGRRSEPYTALAQFGERLENTLAPDAVLPEIVRTLRVSLRLPYAAVRLGDDAPPVEVGTRTTAVETLPLVHHGAPVGSLVVGLRPGESSFSPADRRLLTDLARQAGVAVSAVRLTADVQRSRERLVAAREEERRRLRRDLHDGLGAQLAGLTVQAGVLRGMITRDPEAADALAGELRTELRAAIADIRRLVHELRPPALDELGLVGAVQRLAEKIGAEGGGTRMAVDVPAVLPPLPAAVEVAAYRIVQEALTNVVRHASARSCTVRLAPAPGRLTVEVTDDGTGFPDSATHGVGLSSMGERAAEMGGDCTVEALPAGGTRVRAVLPLPERS
ncbi:histidine kinase [Blastococcus sp. PRF04-17]|uniref:histidine kinase n=1 Tax=Blastococcus sp. PRF04-17 TaxID=2933797 RepID=UPI001FF554CD|nr:histidine kinase [Blastococcus sp. PRF04-17]UOY03661.1 sensor histidine kinase [Blastococcus sp. PRF04-17]